MSKYGMPGNYQGPSGTPGPSVSSVINRIRLEQQEAAYEAEQKRQTWKTVGMAGLKFDKALRDWQMARISSPDMKFTQFLFNPTAAAVAKDATIDMLKENPEKYKDMMPKLLSLKRYKELYTSGKETVSDIYQNKIGIPMKNKKAMRDLFGKGGDTGGLNDYTDYSNIKGEKVPRDKELENWMEEAYNEPLPTGEYTDPSIQTALDKQEELRKFNEANPLYNEIGLTNAEIEDIPMTVTTADGKEIGTWGGDMDQYESLEDQQASWLERAKNMGKDMTNEELQAALEQPMTLTDSDGNVLGEISPEKTPGISGWLQRTLPGGKSGYDTSSDLEFTGDQLKEMQDMPMDITDEFGNVVGSTTETNVEKVMNLPQVKNRFTQEQLDAAMNENMSITDAEGNVLGEIGPDDPIPAMTGDKLGEMFSGPMEITDEFGNVTGSVDLSSGQLPEGMTAEDVKAIQDKGLSKEELDQMLKLDMSVTDADGNILDVVKGQEKVPGLKGMLQRAVPGGETGYQQGQMPDITGDQLGEMRNLSTTVTDDQGTILGNIEAGPDEMELAKELRSKHQLTDQQIKEALNSPMQVTDSQGNVMFEALPGDEQKMALPPDQLKKAWEQDITITDWKGEEVTIPGGSTMADMDKQFSDVDAAINPNFATRAKHWVSTTRDNIKTKIEDFKKVGFDKDKVITETGDVFDPKIDANEPMPPPVEETQKVEGNKMKIYKDGKVVDPNAAPETDAIDDAIQEGLDAPLPTGGPMEASLAQASDVDLTGATDATATTENLASVLKKDDITGSGLLTKGNVLSTGSDVLGAYGGITTLTDDKLELADAKAAVDVSKAGANLAAKAGVEGASKLGTTLGKAAPWMSVAMSANTLLDKKSTDVQKAGAVMSGAGAIAMTNFWNPAGWIAGALTIGGTLMQLFGGKKQKPKRARQQIRGHRGGSGYGYL